MKAFNKIIAIVIIVACLFTTYGVIVFFSPVSIKLDIATQYQTLHGFGASSAWTFQNFGLEEDELTDDIIQYLYGDDGLGLNIFRYNIGAGSLDEALNEIVPYSNEGHLRERRAESFFIADNYIDKSSFSDINNYDFSRDRNIQNMLDKALITGNIDSIVFFSNSPHYLMTHSGKATGDYEYQNNLNPEFFEAYTDYLLLIVDYFYHSKLKLLDKVPTIYISPINEPQWRWGGEHASQEGCHYDPDILAAFLEVFINKVKTFNTANNTQYVIDVFDSGNYQLKNIKGYLAEMSNYDYMDELKHISVHSYWANTSLLKRYRFKRYLERKYPELSLSMTEYCDMQWGLDSTIQSGLYTGKVILRDLAVLNATDWSWWLALSIYDYNDGLVYYIDNEIILPKRYYVMGHFSKFLDEGDTRIKVKSSDIFNISNLDTVAFVKPDGTKVIIIINSGREQIVKLDEQYNILNIITTTDEFSWHYQEVRNNRLTIERDSITTIIIE